MYYILVIDLTVDVDEGGTHEILVHRSKLKQDLIDEFDHNEILQKSLSFGIIGYDGKRLEAGQGIGVQREVLRSFFEDFYGSCCTGASELVPIVRHDMTQLQWEAVARIIIYAIKHGYFPVRLSPAFLKASFLGDIISKEELISSFKNYISIEEKEIVEENMKELSDDTSDLLDVLSAFKCYSRPTKDNLEQLSFIS